MTATEQVASTIPAPAIKQCRCGAVHTSLEWSFLPYVGLMDDGTGGHLELRNCRCESTIAVRK